MCYVTVTIRQHLKIYRYIDKTLNIYLFRNSRFDPLQKMVLSQKHISEHGSPGYNQKVNNRNKIC